MLHPLRPAQIANMHQPVDAVFDLDEGAEVGEVADAPFDRSARRILVLQAIPWIGLQLLHSQRNAPLIRIDAENDVSTWSPDFTNFDGCFMRFDQVISET